MRPGLRAREGGLHAALSAAVVRGVEPEALARHLSQRHGSACLVFEPHVRGWMLAAAQGAGTPLVDEPVEDARRWVGGRLPGRRFLGSELHHGEALVGWVFADGVGREELAAACAIAAPFFAARRPVDALPVAQLVHDLRRPLTTLQLGLERLTAPDGPTMALRRCRAAVTELSDLIGDVLLVTAPEQRAREPVCLRAILDQLAEEMAEAAHLRQVRLDTHLIAAAPLAGNRRALRRALGNLIANAIEASPPGRIVSVRLAEQANAFVIDVHDDGPGIPAALRNRVFEPFFTTRTAGTGLGLTVARAVASAHGGDLTFLDGTGATIRFRLPKATVGRAWEPHRA
jgi:signal transduction histidine kinase